MATLIFAQAKSIRKKVKDAIKLHDDCGSTQDRDDVANNIIDVQRTEFREILKIAQLLHGDYEEIVAKKTTNWFFITVRPKPGITFDTFYDLVSKYVNRAFMKNYTLSFEQKSVTGTGEGFHVHIVCDTKHRSKTECLRDTISTFKQVCDDNCIDIKPTKNPQDIITNYLIEYKSDDEHKAPTQQGDKIWRLALNLAPYYENNLPKIQKDSGLLSSSPGQQQISPIIIELN